MVAWEEAQEEAWAVVGQGWVVVAVVGMAALVVVGMVAGWAAVCIPRRMSRCFL